MIPGDPRYDPAARKKKIADLKVIKFSLTRSTSGTLGNSSFDRI